MLIMSKIRKYLDLFFKISNFTIIILYLYPGSILGWVIYGNLKSQPQLTEDFLSLSSNHLYTFLILSYKLEFNFLMVLRTSIDKRPLPGPNST